MCARAIEIGITDITFTEHLDFCVTDVSFGAFDYSRWMDDLNAAREEFAGRLIIRRGVEVDYQERFRSQIEDYLGSHEFDYILGSAHYVNGVILEDHDDYFPGKSLRDAYIPYFDSVLSAVETGLFQTLAHVDFCKRHGSRYFGAFRLDDFHAEVESILKAAIARGMVIEINTSGLRQPPRETFPAEETLHLYRELGGREVVLGSDSHTVEQLGFGLDVGLGLAARAGLRVVL